MAATNFSGPVVSTNGFTTGSTTLTDSDFAAVQALVSGGGNVAIKRRSLTNVYTAYPASRLATEPHSTADRTTNILRVLAAPYLSVRIGIPNFSASNTIAGCKVCVAPTADTGAAAGSTNATYLPSGGTATFVAATFGGASSGTLPVANSATDESITWTDWIPVQSLDRTDGKPGYPIIVRVLIPGTTAQAGNTNRTVYQSTGLDDWQDESKVGYRVYRAARNDNDSVSTVTNWTGNNNSWSDSHQPVLIQYMSPVSGVQITCNGDSITEAPVDAAGGAPVGYNPSFVAAVALQTATGIPHECCNLGVGSSSNAAFLVKWQRFASAVRPTFAVFSAFSPNLTSHPTAADFAFMGRKCAEFAADAAQYGSVPVFVTGIPSTPTTDGEGSTQGKTWTPAEDQARIAYNARFTVSGGALCVDAGALLLGGDSGSNPGQFKMLQAYSLDGLHPNKAGNTVVGAALAALLV